MNQLRWIFGIPLAFAIIAALLMVNFSVESHFYEIQLYSWISIYYHAFVILVCCSLFVFLSSFFVPTKRKYAAIIALSLIACLAGSTLIVTVFYNKLYNIISIRILLNYAAIFSGLLIGMAISYQVFKNRNWSKPKIIEEDKEIF